MSDEEDDPSDLLDHALMVTDSGLDIGLPGSGLDVGLYTEASEQTSGLAVPSTSTSMHNFFSAGPIDQNLTLQYLSGKLLQFI